MATTKKRGLGRGLGELLTSNATAVVEESNPQKGKLANIPVDLIQRGQYQPRRDMNVEALEELANSIRSQGIIQPIVVRSIGNARYEIIAGERRWRAAQIAELHEVPAIIRETDDEQTLAMALIENVQRENLNPIEEAMALQRLIDEFGMTHQQVADSVSKTRSAVSNLLRLLGLSPDVKKMLEKGELEMGHARALLSLDRAQQVQAARQVVQRNLSVRETENLVRQLQTQQPKLFQAQSMDPDVRALQKRLSETLGVGVQIRHGAKGKGKLVIPYSNLEQLEGVLEHIK